MAADISHPPMEQLQDLEYCIDSNPPWSPVRKHAGIYQKLEI